MSQAPAAPGNGAVQVYWRPGCPFCMMLRPRLRRSGLSLREINIWQDPEAVARVRTITGGDETVPAVVVGTRALVNPTARQVIAAAHAEWPGLAAQQPTAGRWLLRLRSALGLHRRPGLRGPGAGSGPGAPEPHLDQGGTT